jgi:hypothetical protein
MMEQPMWALSPEDATGEDWLTLKKYEEQVKAFLGCYAEIHNLELVKESNANWKHVNAYVRYKTDDHPYCRLITVYVYPEYLGGGRYNPTLMASFPNSHLCGCP